MSAPSSHTGRSDVGEKLPSLSIVIEWENPKNSEVARAATMIRTLAAQLRELAPRFSAPPEILLVQDPGEQAAEAVLASVAADAGEFAKAIQVVTAPTADLDYYDKKNFGAGVANGDLILFLDSDVLPQEGWLRRLLESQTRLDADVIGGATYLESRTPYEKAFALFWFFPLDSQSQVAERTDRFFANNVLFKAAVFRENPFPDAPLVRGRCCLLADSLAQAQKSIYREPTAKVVHPPPNGFSHFVKRAICQGHDNVRMEGDTALTALRRLKWQTRNSLRAIWRGRREVGLSVPGAMLGSFIAAAYHMLELVGEIVTLVSPGFVMGALRV